MKVEILKKKIMQTKEDIKKNGKALENLNGQLEIRTDILTKQGLDPNKYSKYKYRASNIYWDICDYEKKLEQIRKCERKINEHKKLLMKLEQQMKSYLVTEKEKMELFIISS